MNVDQAAVARLTGEGRLFVERGGTTGVIDEYRQHPNNFVVVAGSGNQVAVGVEGSVTQTSVDAGIPLEVWELLDQIESGIQSAAGLTSSERENALSDLATAREQLRREEPNRRAALAVLDPLAKISAVAGFITKVIELLT